MSIRVDVEYGNSVETPSSSDIQAWASATLTPIYSDAELCIRVVDEPEMADLNQSFRQKPQPTNVLSFPAEIPEQPDLCVLGDIAICAAVVEREAVVQQKDSSAHWAHMVVHGCLHLAGYDHIEESEAEEMESLEIQILSDLGYPDPYKAHHESTSQTQAISH